MALLQVVDICKGFKTPILTRHGRPGEEVLAFSIYYTKPHSGDRTLDLVAESTYVRGTHVLPVALLALFAYVCALWQIHGYYVCSSCSLREESGRSISRTALMRTSSVLLHSELKWIDNLSTPLPLVSR